MVTIMVVTNSLSCDRTLIYIKCKLECYSINGVETIEEIPKSVKRNGSDFILSNKVVMIMHYVKKETLVEVEPNSLLRS